MISSCLPPNPANVVTNYGIIGLVLYVCCLLRGLYRELKCAGCCSLNLPRLFPSLSEVSRTSRLQAQWLAIIMAGIQG